MGKGNEGLDIPDFAHAENLCEEATGAYYQKLSQPLLISSFGESFPPCREEQGRHLRVVQVVWD